MQLTPFLRKTADGYCFWCPGCMHSHEILIGRESPQRWEFNGNVDSPSFTPSVRHFSPAQGDRPEQTRCHYYVTDGKIAYCGDCMHALSGQTVDLPPMPPESEYRYPP